MLQLAKVVQIKSLNVTTKKKTVGITLIIGTVLIIFNTNLF